MSVRLVDDEQEIFELLFADPAFTEAVNRNKNGVFLLGANGKKRYIKQLSVESDGASEVGDDA
ncbi:hypothetical protein [Naasia lichenicola]|uniref:Uncharacterized protein n=1 Tax=Naasia lichenicola TaxID=2565933 RepID=A0A4S4FR75_9MICO|nr:hypothetical protein [Naasia lichenicola]THG30699.1 hypothetical protein E6C64_08650 [Naasia lichenicola]THG31936.1 hypothetical protein E6C64_07795 [Naasia lichenicola]